MINRQPQFETSHHFGSRSNEKKSFSGAFFRRAGEWRRGPVNGGAGG
jgi:hypothetical protein